MFATHKLTTWILDLTLITFFLALFYSFGLGSYPLFTPDEGRYSEVAREMVVSGNYITPYLNEVVFLDKPILYYWLQASAIQLFGLKEWALRLWPAIFGVFGCFITYCTSRALFSRRTGILSATILATSPLYFGAAHYANLDLEVAVLISTSLCFFLLGIEYQKRYLFVLAYLFTGLAFLTKGLIGLAFPALIIGTYILILNQFRIILRSHLILGLFLIFIISAPWYFLVQKENPQFFHYFFILQQFSRFLTKADFNNQSIIWFYVPIILAGFVPWSLFTIQAFYVSFKSVLEDRKQHHKELFFLLWFVIVFAFFSIPKSKTVGYILPVFPALAILLGHFISRYWDKMRDSLIMSGIVAYMIISPLLGSLCLLIPYYPIFNVPSGFFPNLTLLGIILVLSFLLVYYFVRTNKTHRAFYTILGTAILFLLIFIESAAIINHKSIKFLALQLKAQMKSEDEVAIYQKYFQDLPIYIEKRITIISDWKASYIPHNDNWQRELWFGMPYKDTSEWLIDEPTFFQRWTGDKRIFVFMYKEYYPYFKNKAQNKVVEIAIDHNFMLVSNKSG